MMGREGFPLSAKAAQWKPSGPGWPGSLHSKVMIKDKFYSIGQKGVGVRILSVFVLLALFSFWALAHASLNESEMKGPSPAATVTCAVRVNSKHIVSCFIGCFQETKWLNQIY